MRTVVAWLALVSLLVPTGTAAGQDVQRLRPLAELPRANLGVALKFNSAHGFFVSWSPPDAPAEIARLRASLRDDGTDAEAYYRLAELMETVGQNDASRRCYARAAELFYPRVQAQPQGGWLLAQYGQAWAEAVDQARWHEAEPLLRQAATLAPEDWRCWAALGRILQRKALGELAHDGRETVRPDGDAIAARVAAPASQEQMKQRLAEVEQCFDRAVAAAPQDPRPYIQRALARPALAVCRSLSFGERTGQAAFAGVFSPECARDLWEAARLQGKDCRAVAVAAIVEYEALRLRGYADDHQAVAAAVHRAEAFLLPLTEAGPAPPAAEAWETLGIVRGACGLTDRETEACFHRAVALEPSRPVAWHMLLSTLARMGRVEDAAEVCRDRLRHADTPQNRVDLAYVLEHCDRLSEAQEQVREALRLGPRDYAANLAQAVILLKYGGREDLARVKELLDNAAAALGEAPSDARRAELATYRGIYLALADDVAGARLCFHEALRGDGGKETAGAALRLLGP
jgi:tetratricopeptide (TPR) repeat protein